MNVADLYAMPRNLVLAASAGTGKTHALVGVVVHLLLGARAGGAVDPGRIVATTFSRKAAGEIRARVASEVELLAHEPARSVYAEGLRSHLGARASDAEIGKRARRALERLPQARFGTLHSFATGIVQRYAVELGLGPGFAIATEADSRARAEDAIAGALERRLDEHGQHAVRSLAEAAGGIDRLVLAGRRILSQLEEDGRSASELVIDPGDVRLLEARMTELVRHARAVAGHPKAEEAARALGLAWDTGDEDGIEEAAAALTAIPATGKKTAELEAFFVFRNDLAGATNPERGRRLARAWRSRERFDHAARLFRDVIAEAEIEIERTGRVRAVLGFGEVLRAARQLLVERPDIAEEVSGGIDALLVDEFQDTSRVQRDLLQLLWARREGEDRPAAGNVPPLASMRPRGLLVVGDRKQSIYGFRGADVAVFAELAVGLAGAPARDALGIPRGVTWEPDQPLADFHALRHNRRSVPTVLAFANAFSARRFLVGEPPPELFEIAYVAETEDLLVPDSAGTLPGTESVPGATWLRVQPKGPSSTRLEEALVIAQHVRQIIESESPQVGKVPRAPQYRDLAVLATTNGMLDAVSFALAQAGVPYVVAGKSFYRAREISDLAAMLALVLEPTDRLAMLEVLRGPWAAVHDETLLGLSAEGKGLVPPSAWSAPPHPELVRPEDKVALEAIAALVGSLGRCVGRLGAGAVLREAVTATAFEAVLRAMPRGEQRVANVQKLLAMADRYPDTRAFRTFLDEAKEQEVAESEAATFSDDDDAVRLLTIHASKGLDFPIVFLPEIGAQPPRADRGLARVATGAGDTPNTLSVLVADDAGFVLESPSHVRAQANARRRERAERQRLAYVAVTRAAHHLFLVGGRNRDTELDPGASTLAVIEELARVEPPILTTLDVAVAPPSGGSPSAGPELLPASERGERHVPRWRSLPIAPTALADFDHCARRFELVHLLGLPEHARGRSAGSGASSPAESPLDARAQGTLAHAILEQLPLEVLFDPELAERRTTAALATAGVPEEHPQHGAIAARVMRFVRTSYARELAAAGATLEREVAFVLPITAGDRTVTLRGSMDLVARWPDERVDVVDYKSARGGDTGSYAFQLAVYALAARARFPRASGLRIGLSFLGGGDGEPVWRDLPSEDAFRARIMTLGEGLVDARWRDQFPRVEIARCETIHCGFIGRCHPERQ